jgi:16S rRNA (cytosine1402-N4)-methyltransferase
MGEPTSRFHVPVLREAVIELLGCHAGGVYVDGTVGGGGYAEAILQASAPDGVLIALDSDAEAIARVRIRLPSYQNRLFLAKANFADLPHHLEKLGLGPVDGIVVDLGVSSFQLTDGARGFSFMLDGPLDMRMDRDLPQTAADLVNLLSERDLADVIRRLSEERWASRIARAVVSRRRIRPFLTTLDLSNEIAKVVPKTKDSLRIHPATRTFQALRLAVNRELESLERFLDQALDLMKPGGRLCTVAFHSLEDRIIKRRFREWSRACTCPKSIPQCQCDGEPLVKVLTRRPLRPGPGEIESNPSSRSARLRAVEKWEGRGPGTGVKGLLGSPD